MKLERRLGKLLVEPAAVATGDIAFNLIVFFLICASTQPDSGRPQTLPSAEEAKQTQENKQNLEVVLLRDVTLLDGQRVDSAQLEARLKTRFQGKTRPEERIVVLKSDKSAQYARWIAASIAIEKAGGTITIQREETRVESVP